MLCERCHHSFNPDELRQGLCEPCEDEIERAIAQAEQESEAHQRAVDAGYAESP